MDWWAVKMYRLCYMATWYRTNQNDLSKKTWKQHTTAQHLIVKPWQGFTLNSTSNSLFLLIFHTFPLYFKCDFSVPASQAYSPVSFFSTLLSTSWRNLSLCIHVNCSAGTQLFAIFVSFHVFLVINYLIVQNGSLRDSSFHFPLDKLFVEESRLTLDFSTSDHKIFFWYNYHYKRIPQHRKHFGFIWQHTKPYRCSTQSKTFS